MKPLPYLAILTLLLLYYGCTKDNDLHDVQSGNDSDMNARLANDECVIAEIYLTTQEEVDNFHCESGNVTGRIIVSGENISNLSNLSNTIERLNGELVIMKNPALDSVAGFDKIDRIYHRLVIIENPNLKIIDGFNGMIATNSITIYDNPALESIQGFVGLTDMGAHLQIRNNESLNEITAFTALGRLNGNIHFTDLPNLESMDFFENLFALNGIEIENTAVKDASWINQLGDGNLIQDKVKIVNNPEMSIEYNNRLCKWISNISDFNNNVEIHGNKSYILDKEYLKNSPCKRIKVRYQVHHNERVSQAIHTNMGGRYFDENGNQQELGRLRCHTNYTSNEVFVPRGNLVSGDAAWESTLIIFPIYEWKRLWAEYAGKEDKHEYPLAEIVIDGRHQEFINPGYKPTITVTKKYKDLDGNVKHTIEKRFHFYEHSTSPGDLKEPHNIFY
ncbi:hypothetical protein [Aureivirga marina]|uniref:hypothetical protein n=1 Tax=Aureivirga marina TaxID=1182451 RepID=UPI0018CBB2D2|nr:hypothetical protein [Aureivirga marina]